MTNFSDLQSDFSHKSTVLTKILLGNVCWLALIIIGEFNDHFKSGLGKSDISVQRYRKYTRINEKLSLLRNALYSNFRANFGRF